MTRRAGLTLYGLGALLTLETCNWIDGAGLAFDVLVAPAFALASVLMVWCIMFSFDAMKRVDAIVAGATWENCPGCTYQRSKGHLCLKCGNVENRRTKPLSRREREAAERVLRDYMTNAGLGNNRDE